MAITCLDGTALDERIIKVGMDPGFKQGRQYGRGMSGGQVSVLALHQCKRCCFESLFKLADYKLADYHTAVTKVV